MIRAAVFGVGAVLAGTAVYYVVERVLHVGMIGILAILVGYMVGYAVRQGAGGRGGRRFQVLAVILTYCAIDFGYAVVALNDVATIPVRYLLALPVLVSLGSMPFGLITALIIFIGMRQAWVMTSPHVIDISGPFKVGTGAAPTPA